jgi:hypothetical protein
MKLRAASAHAWCETTMLAGVLLYQGLRRCHFDRHRANRPFSLSVSAQISLSMLRHDQGLPETAPGS